MISVIIPVYNAERYLRRCVQSVLVQQHRDLELILVDDGSTDSSAGICDTLAAEDSRIRVIHKANGGAGSARNAGLDAARGEWIAFADSDDYVLPTYLSDMLGEAELSGCDLVITGCTFEGGERRYPDARIDAEHTVETFTRYKVNKSSCVWGKLFRTSLIGDDIRFDEGVIFSEDLLFSAQCFIKAKGISLMSRCNYHYDMRGESLCHYVYDFETERHGFEEFLKLQRQLEGLFPSIDFVDAVDAAKYLKRAISALYSGRYNRTERLQGLSTLKFDGSKLCFKSTNIKEMIYHYAIRHKLWPIVDMISQRVIPASGTKFK